MLTAKTFFKQNRGITKEQAQAFGVPWPLREGWLDVFGANTCQGTIPPNKSWKKNHSKRRKHTTSYSPHTDSCWNMGKRPKPLSNSDDFYNSRAWRTVRYLVLRNTDGRCQCCGAAASDGVRIHVDHVKPRSKYPELALDINNLQVLCEDCNFGKCNWDETDWRSN